MMEELVLPVSIGEALDKLTILDIKQDKINDNRLIEIKKEYNVLNDKLKEYISKYSFYYNMLKNTNLDIWNMLDDIKSNNHDDNIKLKLYEIMWDKNDIRFKIKDRINNLSQSILKEQKGYSKNSILINICDKVNFDFFIDPLKYYTFLYDKVYVNINKEVNFDTEYPVEFIKNKENININVNKTLDFLKDQYDIKEIYHIFNITEDIVKVYKDVLFKDY